MLNEQQSRAVNSDSKNIVVIAAAGSGKTTVLIERISRLVTNGADPKSILVLTFTNAAAHEMKTRYIKKMGNTAGSPDFGTFHSFCYSLIAADPSIRTELGYSTIPKLATESDIKEIRASARSAVGTKLSDSMLDGKESSIPQKKRFEYVAYWKMYNKLLRKAGLITFDIMCYDVCNLFANKHPSVECYKSRYKHILCDENQDSDQNQWNFVSSFTDSNIFAVGDAKQNLYSFRGTTSEILKGLANNPEWETIILPRNYRSTKEVCEYANRIHFMWSKDDPFNVQMVSDREGEPVNIRSKFRTNVADDLLSIVGDTGTVAILCRTNSEVATITSMLNDYGMSYYTNKKSRIIPDILHSAIDESYLLDWLSSELSADAYADYLRLKCIVSDFDERKFIELFGGKFRSVLDKIMNVRKMLAQYSDGRMLQFVIELGRLFDCDFMDYATEAMSLPPMQLIEKMIDDLTTDKESNSDLYVGTIHSSKGLEYDSVHLIGVNGKSFPAFKNEDQMNCFYVGCTRAKNKLTLWVDDPDSNYLQPADIFESQ